MYTRRHSPFLPVGQILVLLGSIVVFAGFFLPWITVRPTSTLGDLGEIAGSALGSSLGFGGLGGIVRDITKSFVVNLTGLDLATGVTVDDMLPSGAIGSFARIGASLDSESSATLSQRVLAPLLWLFVFPLLGVAGAGLSFSMRRGGALKLLTVLGFVVLVLMIIHIIVLEVGVHRSLQSALHSSSPDDALLSYLASALIKVKVGVGAWLTLLGSLIWVAGAATTPATVSGGRRGSRRIGGSPSASYASRPRRFRSARTRSTSRRRRFRR